MRFIFTPKRLLADLLQTLIPLALGIVLILAGEQLAQVLGMPALAIAGTLGGIALAGLGPARLMRRMLFPGVDLGALVKRAVDSPDGPGRVFQGICIVIAALILALSGGTARADDGGLPGNAERYLPLLQAEQARLWPGMPMPSALGAQVEQETCPGLRHRHCWSPHAQLRTAREQGVGLPQITRAFRADGSVRFDSLAELQAQYPDELRGWGWGSPSLHDPVLQLRALVLMDHRNWRAISGSASTLDRLSMMLASYNGGLRGLAADRALCAGTPACDPGQWVGHVERTCSKSTTPAAGYRLSWCDINREYPRNILGPRRGKYVARMEEKS